MITTLLPDEAFASCTSTGIGYVVDSPSSPNQYGARVEQDLVVNPSTACGIVRSLQVFDNILNFVEVGWFEDDGAGGFTFEDCQDFSSPHVLVYARLGNIFKCKQNPPTLPLAEPNYSFRVDNPDHDTDWVYYYDDDNSPDISLGFFNTDMTNGYPRTQDERHDSTDNLRASFVLFNSLGGQGEWHAYPSAQQYPVGDVGSWDVCSWSSTNLTVKLTC